MQTQFYIYSNGQQEGPFTIGEIESRMKSHQLSMGDYIYVEEKSDWIMLMDFEPLKGMKPNPKKDGRADFKTLKHEENLSAQEWFVLKGENRYGPFALTELIKMLQEKSLFEYEYIWRSGMSNWQRVAEVDEFKPEKIRELKEVKDMSEVFFRRRHARAKYDGSIIVHDNKRVWKGRGIEISAGGAGLVIENSMLIPGQVLYLHFKPGDGVPPFNAVCEVVSKRFLKGIKHQEQAIHYGVKFTTIGDKAIGNLTHYAEKAKVAA